MNRRQKLVLWVGITMVTLMGIFPPWLYRFQSADLTWQAPAGHHTAAYPKRFGCHHHRGVAGDISTGDATIGSVADSQSTA